MSPKWGPSRGTSGGGKPLSEHSCKWSWELKMAGFSVPLLSTERLGRLSNSMYYCLVIATPWDPYSSVTLQTYKMNTFKAQPALWRYFITSQKSQGLIGWVGVVKTQHCNITTSVSKFNLQSIAHNISYNGLQIQKGENDMFIIKDESKVKFNVWNYGIMSKNENTVVVCICVLGGISTPFSHRVNQITAKVQTNLFVCLSK